MIMYRVRQLSQLNPSFRRTRRIVLSLIILESNPLFNHWYAREKPKVAEAEVAEGADLHALFPRKLPVGAVHPLTAVLKVLRLKNIEKMADPITWLKPNDCFAVAGMARQM